MDQLLELFVVSMDFFPLYGRFLSRVSTLTRDIDIAILSVCPSVCLSVFRYEMKTA